MKNDRTAAAIPTAASIPAQPGRTAPRRLPDCLASLVAASTPERKSAARGRIEPNAFSRAEMRDIVLEMIG